MEKIGRTLEAVLRHLRVRKPVTSGIRSVADTKRIELLVEFIGGGKCDNLLYSEMLDGLDNPIEAFPSGCTSRNGDLSEDLLEVVLRDGSPGSIPNSDQRGESHRAGDVLRPKFELPWLL